MLIKVVGQDPSLRHWGLSKGVFDTETGIVTISEVQVIEPVLSKSKQVRQNSLDIESAKQLFTGALEASKHATAVFIEVPVGSQSARAMASYGICVGVIGALRAAGKPVYEVSPAEVKLAGPKKANATKLEMIEWAMQKHPDINWPTHKQRGITSIIQSRAEHEADATAAIYAGIASNSFQQHMLLLQNRA